MIIYFKIKKRENGKPRTYRNFKTGRQKLFPIRLVDYKNIKKWDFFYGKIGQDLTDEICEYYIPDFSNWDKDNKKYEKEFKKLLRDIEKGKKKIS